MVHVKQQCTCVVHVNFIAARHGRQADDEPLNIQFFRLANLLPVLGTLPHPTRQHDCSHASLGENWAKVPLFSGIIATMLNMEELIVKRFRRSGWLVMCIPQHWLNVQKYIAYIVINSGVYPRCHAREVKVSIKELLGRVGSKARNVLILAQMCLLGSTGCIFLPHSIFRQTKHHIHLHRRRCWIAAGEDVDGY